MRLCGYKRQMLNNNFILDLYTTMTTFEPIQLGTKDTYVNVCKWKDNTKIHIRVYHRNYNGNLIPQKCGICMDIDEFKSFTKNLSVLQKQIVTLENEKRTGLSELKKLLGLKETDKQSGGETDEYESSGEINLKRKRKSKIVTAPKKVKIMDEETII